IAALVASTASGLSKISLDAVIQDDMPEHSRASAFGLSETILQLAWCFGGAIGVLLPTTFWLGFTVVAAVMALGAAQTVICRRGGSLVPGFGGNRPIRPKSNTAGPGQSGQPPNAQPSPAGAGGVPTGQPPFRAAPMSGHPMTGPPASAPSPSAQSPGAQPPGAQPPQGDRRPPRRATKVLPTDQF
ncbi:MAG: hypothetical protein J2O49_03560, partial [Sciscionella sp.]|nr:hypothetical protein [Sciscionella sp.]